MSAERITYPSASGGVQAYLAKPDSGSAPWPGLIVIQEVFGLVDHIEDLARRFAGEGYVAIAPDLYCHDQVKKTIADQDLMQAMGARSAPDPEAVLKQLPPERESAARKALEWLTKRDMSTYVPDLRAAVDYLRSRPDVRKNAIGSIGYCMGGMLSGALAASGIDIQAAVIYYGQNPWIDQVQNIRCPVQGHYGGEDPNITSGIPKLDEAMKKHGKPFTHFVYEGAKHAFFNDQRPNYHPGAAKLAWGRTIDFLGKHVKGAR